MPRTVAENATMVLEQLAREPGRNEFKGAEIVEATGLSPDEVNDAVAILVENGYAEWIKFLGTAPFEFGVVHITSRGRYEYERVHSTSQVPEASKAGSGGAGGTSAAVPTQRITTKPPTPIGSPYGFSDEDWELVAERKGTSSKLFVVLGFQFASTHYDSGKLKANVESMFARTAAEYNKLPHAIPAELDFRALGAGYGEHLFNEIARDIISADIAVFDTSDLNPNVMLEFGVALTWGVRVLPIKKEGTPKPPSDVSGQTWVDHNDSAAAFPDADHERKLVRMVERAIRKKVRG